MTAKQMHFDREPANPASAPVLLQVEGVGKSFGGVRANADVSFGLHAGELLALIGPNGAGKSTLFNMINGQLRPDTGSIIFDGTDITGRSPRAIWRLGIGRTFQVAQPFQSMTTIENVQTALLSRDGRLFNIVSRVSDYAREEALALLDLVQLADQADRPCSAMAYGDIKRLELAVALAHRPRLLLMDEPTAGMAPRERIDLMALTRDLVQRLGTAVLFTEHSMDVVFGYADRIIVLARGHIIADDMPAAIRENQLVAQVYLGSGAALAQDLDAGRDINLDRHREIS